MLLFCPLHIRRQYQAETDNCNYTHDTAGKSDPGDGAIGADCASQPGSAADPQIKDAGEDGHGYSRSGLGGGFYGLRLESYVKGSSTDAPEYAQGNHSPGTYAGRR